MKRWTQLLTSRTVWVAVTPLLAELLRKVVPGIDEATVTRIWETCIAIIAYLLVGDIKEVLTKPSETAPPA